MPERHAPVTLRRFASISSLHPAEPLPEEGTSQRPKTATAKVVADWPADTGRNFLIRQKVETIKSQPERKVEHYESREVTAKEIENTSILDEWEEHKRTAPESYSAISEFNHENWKAEKESRRQAEEHKLSEVDHRSKWGFPQVWHFLCIRT